MYHGVVQLLPGRGETVGAQLSQDDRIQALCLRVRQVAKILQKTVAKRLSQMVNRFRSLRKRVVKMR